jgi:hypothetical protein
VSVLEIFLKGLFIFLGLLAMAVISIPGKPVLGTYAPQENNQRVAMAMLGFVMLVLGTFTLSLAGNQIATKLAASKWPRIEASIEKRELYHHEGRNSRWCVSLEYSYTVSGVQFHSNKPAPTMFSDAGCFVWKKDAESEFERFPIGSGIYAFI